VRYVLGSLLLFAVGTVIAGQTYVAPPPPKLPAVISRERVGQGKNLFERNVWTSGKVEIHNYLGARACGSCHDQPTPLSPDSLAKNFAEIRQKINSEIVARNGGKELPPQDPALEALVQYIVDHYRLYDHKLLK